MMTGYMRRSPGLHRSMSAYLHDYIKDADVLFCPAARLDDAIGDAESAQPFIHVGRRHPELVHSQSSFGSSVGPGTGWDYTEHTWTVPAGMTGLVVEARTYSSDGDIVHLDNLYVSVPDHVYVQIPGCSPVAAEHGTWSSLKNLYR